MSRRCQLTGRSPGSGRNVSHSHVRTPRTFGVNVQDRRYWVPSLGRHVPLRLSAKGLKAVDQGSRQHADRGIESVVARLRARGERI